MDNTIKPTPKRNRFNLKYQDLTPEEIQREILYTNQLQLEKLHSIKNNTLYLFIGLIIVPIVVVALLGGFSFLA